ncbi:PREDICTED: CREB/ATF bZIP transcription factor-like [Amphimedon queenslandica]|uniref:X-box-binding protein 1 n=1 Tax=Amphimedon queenslandica TaxID=400682 RepID=A0AAN0II51_AMPQE|nr:PREDICTED: CREB/ATF bZIP transcription factor-like [Amphimedon queenslandica]|eukprot:XP_003390481.2 PREDICTED: CREB/ATF bZIP transcription factor-like [Amphimedon queenslandica]
MQNDIGHPCLLVTVCLERREGLSLFLSVLCMDVLTLGQISTGSNRALLSDSSNEAQPEELELLTGFQGTDTLSINFHSPSDYSSESGLTSPGTCTLIDDDFFDGLLNSDDLLLSCSTELETPPEPKPTQSPVPLPRKDSPKNNNKPVSMHEPKVRVFQDGRKLNDAAVERNRKNAIAARANRQKKKEYVSKLEEQVESLSAENKSLFERCRGLEGHVSDLKQEVVYLKSVLANQSSLSSILRGLPDIKGVSLQSSFSSTAGSKRQRSSGAEEVPLQFKKLVK